MRSYPERLSITVLAWASMTICSEDRNGIPKMRGIESPTFTLARIVLDDHFPFPNCNTNFTNSLHVRGFLDKQDRLSSMEGRG